MRKLLISIKMEALGMIFKEEEEVQQLSEARKIKSEEPRRVHGWPCMEVRRCNRTGIATL